MSIPKRYNPRTAELRLQTLWQDLGVYHFSEDDESPRYIIDTPPPTVSGNLHLGHVYSYSHADFFARFWRMNGKNVLYPMGYDDNGLPTERLVERRLNVRATDLGRSAFIEKCLEVSQEAEKDYEALWKRLALSIDWRYTYRTIDRQTRRISQLSFLDLFKKGLVYRQSSPAIWCPECRTSIAQAELDDLERDSEFVTLDFRLDDGTSLPIATTRPELLPACVAVFIHPNDKRYLNLVGRQVTVPLLGQRVSVLADPDADPEKGTGVVMCCTFGDTTDVSWWFKHDLPLVEAIDRDGRMTGAAGDFSGLSVLEARSQVKKALAAGGLLLGSQATSQSIRVHERCDTPVEYIVASQWFIRILDFKDQFLEAGEKIAWYPDHMKNRYRQWVTNLNWDWCISRQRYYGVTFPVWYCLACGEVMPADEAELPVDPTERSPAKPCPCGSNDFKAEEDVMDTWATSSLTPQLVARWLGQSGFDGQGFLPVTLRTQAHEIIRTWAFYSIVKASHHFSQLPWQEAVISGWGLSPQGAGKISKSKGGGPVTPMEMIERHSADAVRYWAASTGLGKDAIISEERIQAGAKLVTKLWNVARFSQPFFSAYQPPETTPRYSPADRWILSRLQQVIRRATLLYQDYDYATAKSQIEIFFWNEVADNYLEMAKKRLYEENHLLHEGAKFALYQVLLALIKLFAPLLPHVTEEVYLGLFAGAEDPPSIHAAPWPQVNESLINIEAEEIGANLIQIATAARRYKSNAGLSLGAELPTIRLATVDERLVASLVEATSDLISITRAQHVIVAVEMPPGWTEIPGDGPVLIGIEVD